MWFFNLKVSLSLKNGGRWSNVVNILGFTKVKSIKVTLLFDREECDADRCRKLTLTGVGI